MRNRIAPVLLVLSLFGATPATGQPDHVTFTTESCVKCHRPEETAELSAKLTRPCSNLCSTCHEFRETHHPVGVTIPGPVPGQLRLTRKGTNACVTCHDVTRPRFESSAWVSQSFFDRTLRRSKENRTYYLVTRNDRGQLCRSCH
ncbi:MAG: hypothetical protein DIJKHBIC_03289 [Thermoanaerobaculia bacterium]|nr:hypothetical protein [Thermoanaerobaculia bacterium]